MNRRGFLFALSLVALCAPLTAAAQPAEKVRRIGFLGTGPAASSPFLSGPWSEAFRQGLREFGWVEGDNIVIVHRHADGRFDRLPELAAELVRVDVDMIVTMATPATAAAAKATKTVPIVMINAGDPVGLGLVASLARPGWNVTGLAYSVGLETIGKALEPLKEAVPSLRHVAVLTNPANPAQPLATRDLEVAARSLGVQLQLLEPRSPDEFDSAFAAMAGARAEALLIVADSLFFQNRARLAELVARSRLPSMYGIKEHLEHGGLMSYGVDFAHQFRRAAVYVDKILKGARPADLPVEQPTRFELVINLKTAKALGIEIPQALLARADEVIE